MHPDVARQCPTCGPAASTSATQAARSSSVWQEVHHLTAGTAATETPTVEWVHDQRIQRASATRRTVTKRFFHHAAASFFQEPHLGDGGRVW